MKKHKKIIFAGIIILFLAVIFFSPPIMIAKYSPILGTRTENFDDPAGHDGVKELPYRKHHTTTDFEYFYFLNFRFWEELKIQQIKYKDSTPDAEVKKILPFLYSAEQNQKYTYQNTFGVQRGG